MTTITDIPEAGTVRDALEIIATGARHLPRIEERDLFRIHDELMALAELADGPASEFYKWTARGALSAVVANREDLHTAEVSLRWGGHVIDALHYDATAAKRGRPPWLAVCFCETEDLVREPTREAAIDAGRRHLLAMGCDPENFDLDMPGGTP